MERSPTGYELGFLIGRGPLVAVVLGEMAQDDDRRPEQDVSPAGTIFLIFLHRHLLTRVETVTVRWCCFAEA